MEAQELIRITGQHQLFLGIPTHSWTLDQFRQAAQFAKAHDVSCLLVKTHDGTNAWYNDIGGWSAVRQAILREGVGAIPYIYSYGDKFGGLDTEIDIIIAHMQDSGVACMDCEAEWNGQVAWAEHLCSRIQPVPGTFLVSTWADPSLQNWSGVVQALAPCTTVFMPQQYNNYLATFWQEFGNNGATWLQPTVNLTQDFGANDPVAIAQAAAGQGHTAISVWYYDTAKADPGLLDAIYAAFPKGGQTVQQYTPNSGDFASWFTVDTNGNWLCTTYKTVIIGENKTLYSQLSIDGQTLPIIGLPIENEQYHIETDGYQWSSQQFERGTIHYDPAHRFDSVPGMGASYLAHVNPPQTQIVVALPAPLATKIQTVAEAAADMQKIAATLPKTT